MNYVPPYMNYNQKQGNYDGNLENPFKENYYQAFAWFFYFICKF